MTSGSETSPPVVVIDTNVVLDWLVFREPAALETGRAIVEGRLVWRGTAAMLQELAHVLSTGRLDRWGADAAEIVLQADRWCRQLDAPARGAAGPGLRCSDPDDQMFVDFAFVQRGGWLLSRDRAVLKLAARLRRHGVQVMTPERWLVAWRAPDGSG